jgi:hypothetical protein
MAPDEQKLNIDIGTNGNFFNHNSTKYIMAAKLRAAEESV